ncbi:MAG TPA: hypothetical protein VHU23_00885 [Rhizomicrobium sp.]|nr:hypothetical protein [Rhizomicrobium sp.]
MGAGNRITTIETLALKHGFFDVIKEYWKSVSDSAFVPQDKRNRVVHDPWFWNVKTHEPKQHRSMPKKKATFGLTPVSERELTDLIVAIQTLRDSALKLRQTVKEVIASRN